MNDIPIRKTCGKCKETKPSTEFFKCKTGKYGLGHACKSCEKERNDLRRQTSKYKEADRRRQRRWRENNPGKQLERVTRIRERKYALVAEKKKDGCLVCGYNKCDRALDLHHINKDSKEGNISEMIRDNSFSKLTSELEKCVVLCANCHREHHAGVLDLDGIGLEETNTQESLTSPAE